MKYVAPVAAGVGWSMEEAAAAIAKMSDAGIQGSQAGTSLRATILSLASPTGQAAKVMEKYGIEVMNANGEMKPMPELVGHIAERLDGLTKAQKTAALSHLVGREAAAGFIALIEAGEGNLRSYVGELERSGGVAQEVAEVQKNTLNGALAEMKSALEGLGIAVGEQFIPVLRAIAEGFTSLTRSIRDINPEILASGAAFLGASSGVAAMSSSVGLLLLGLRGFGPLLGPAGWIITGLSILAGLFATNAVKQATMRQETEKSVDAQYRQVRSTEDLIDRFEYLRDRANMTNREFAEFLDIRKRLETETRPEVIQELTDRMNYLQDKSNLTKKEWDELVELNKKLIELYPHHGQALSNLGQEYIANIDAIKEMNAEQRRQMQLDLWNQMNKGLREYNESQKRAKDALEEYSKGTQRLQELSRERNNLQLEMEDIERRLESARENGSLGELRRLLQAREEIKRKIGLKDEEISKQEDLNGKLSKEVKDQEKLKQELIKKAEQYADILLYENDINMASGKNLENIYKQIDANQKILDKYDERRSKGDSLSKLEREHYDSLVLQNGKLNSILDTVGARELLEEDIVDILYDQKSAAEETNNTLNTPTIRKHDHKDVDAEGKKAKENTEELNKKTKKVHDYSDIIAGKHVAEQETKEANKKTKKPQDISDLKAGTKEAEKTTKEANKKTKKPQDRSDLVAATKEAEKTTKEANKGTKKPLNYKDISSALSVAKSLHDWLIKPASKIVRVTQSITQSIVGGKKHQGGIVPSFHTGGVNNRHMVAMQSGVVPGIGEVNAQLLGGEMVLTKHQQAKLFRQIQHMGTGTQQQPPGMTVIQNNNIHVEGNIDTELYDQIMRKQANDTLTAYYTRGLRRD